MFYGTLNQRNVCRGKSTWRKSWLPELAGVPSVASVDMGGGLGLEKKNNVLGILLRQPHIHRPYHPFRSMQQWLAGWACMHAGISGLDLNRLEHCIHP